jgi:hypothetical protein
VTVVLIVLVVTVEVAVVIAAFLDVDAVVVDVRM